MGALYTCPHCKGVFFVGWDGTPEIVTHEPEPPKPAPLTPPPPLDSSAFDLPDTPPGDFPAGHDGLDGPIEYAAVESDGGYPEPTAETVTETETPDAGETAAMEPAPEEPVNFDEPLGSVFDEKPSASSGDFGDVANYANSEDVAGPMTYSIQIRGIELAETFERLREAVTDSRFGWDANEIMAKIQGGQLILRGLNPTKASLVVNRIKYLSLEISWKQEVFGEGS